MASISMPLLSMAERVTRRMLSARGVKSRVVRTSLGEQHLYDAAGRGSLPTIVLVHGINASATPFAPVLMQLLPHARRVLVPEAPGHGFSGAPTSALTPSSLFESMAELFDRELDEPALFVGNSLGGATALRYAIRRPDRTFGLFLVSPAGAAMSSDQFDALIATFRVRTNADARAFLDRLYHRPAWFSPLIAGEVRRSFARDAIVSLTGSARHEDLFSPNDLAKLVTPTRLVWGQSERLLPPESLAFWKANLPSHVTIEEPAGFGHCPHLDAPARLTEKILAFARSTARGTG